MFHNRLIQVLAGLFLAADPLRPTLGQTQTPGRVAAQLEPGLKVTFNRVEGDPSSKLDFTTRPNVWLYVPVGQEATAFLSPGKFTAEWSGFVSLDLRSEYTVYAGCNGYVKVELNGSTVLETNGTGVAVVPGRTVRLSKGPNALKVAYRSPESGDAFMRLEWAPKGGLPAPMPLSALSHTPDTELQKAQQLRLGRELVAEYRCAKCHLLSGPPAPRSELAMDAPSFDGLGARRNYAWLVDWILDPKAQRTTARMPQIFHGPAARKDAEAASAFLASLKGTTFKMAEATGEQREAGQKLFDALHCAACHTPPNETEVDPARMSLKHLPRKFAVGALASFLQRPEEHYAWTRMPNFKLSEEEAARLAVYLEANGDNAERTAAPAESALLERGEKLIQSTGCLNCHSLKIANQFSTKALADLPAGRWAEGCLAETPGDGNKAPRFGFSAAEREALRAFAGTDRSALSRFIPAEFAERQVRSLHCQECHGKVEGFPPLEILGGKLKPEWTRSFLAGKVPYKPRPWLEARMPAFTSRADGLAQGFAMWHGFPAQTPVERPLDSESAKIGQKLVSAAGGFSCIACHAVGELGATQVFDSPGINLTYAGERLLKPYFQRWLRNPLAIDPGTKMPVYFDEEGRSPLADILDGDGAKQLDAIWEYLRLGDKMPPPPAP